MRRWCLGDGWRSVDRDMKFVIIFKDQNVMMDSYFMTGVFFIWFCLCFDFVINRQHVFETQSVFNFPNRNK